MWWMFWSKLELMSIKQQPRYVSGIRKWATAYMQSPIICISPSPLKHMFIVCNSVDGSKVGTSHLARKIS